jgi:hypothetical protein
MAYLTRTQVLQRFPIPKSRTGLRNWIRRQGFPAPVYANRNCPIFDEDRIVDWFASRPANRLDTFITETKRR